MAACSPAGAPETLPKRVHPPVGAEYLKGWQPNTAEIAEYRTHFGDSLTHTTTLKDRTVELTTSDGVTLAVSLNGDGARPGGSIAQIHRSSDSFRMQTHGERLVAMFRDGARKIIRYPEGGLLEEALPLCARRIAHPRIRLGRAWHYIVLRANTLDWESIHLELSNARHTVETPAGAFRAHRFTARMADGQLRTWWTEIDPPHRIVRFERSDGFQATLARPFRQLPLAK